MATAAAAAAATKNIFFSRLGLGLGEVEPHTMILFVRGQANSLHNTKPDCELRQCAQSEMM